MGPVAATPVKPLPEMAPMIAQVTAQTTPSPPRIRPMKMSTKSSSRLAIPLPAMSKPAKMYRGDARSTVLIIWLKPQTIKLFMLMSMKRAMKSRAPPKQKGRGTLSRSRTTSRMTSRKTTYHGGLFLSLPGRESRGGMRRCIGQLHQGVDGHEQEADEEGALCEHERDVERVAFLPTRRAYRRYS